MSRLGIRLAEGENYRLLDLFDKRHAKKVLALFGQGFGALPKPGPFTKEQDSFLNQAISGLSDGDYVICVRLALFAEMLKAKEWTPLTLKQVGGAEGVGKTFLEEHLSKNTAKLEVRRHVRAAQQVLAALLPEPGTSIKGAAKSKQSLLEASGYYRRPELFEELLDILNTDLRLITPTEVTAVQPDGAQQTEAASSEQYYQLSHDFIVPSLREWHTEGQERTWRGRAELLLQKRAMLWNAKPEIRQLPGLWEYLNIRAYVRKTKWTEPQVMMMRRAAIYHGIRAVFVTVLAVGIVWTGFTAYGEWKNRMAMARRPLYDADIRELGVAVNNVTSFGSWMASYLENDLTTSGSLSDSSDAVSDANICAALLRLNRTERLWGMLEFQSDPTRRSHVVDRLHLGGGNADLLLRRLPVEDNESIRQGIILCLSHFDPVRLFRQDRIKGENFADVTSTLTQMYRSDPSPAVHSAITWFVASHENAIEAEMPSSGSVTDAEFVSKLNCLKEIQRLRDDIKKIDDDLSKCEDEQERCRWYVNNHGITMVLAPAGQFLMGSPSRDGAATDERPQHPVKISYPFYISQQAVSQSQFKRIMGFNPSDRPQDSEMSGIPVGDNEPVDNVEWNIAIEFCNRLSEAEGLQPFYDTTGHEVVSRGGCGYRLPTEAEWEYACRAGTTSAWSFGSDPSLVHRDMSMPNFWGLWVHQRKYWRVVEWCWDWYHADYYKSFDVNLPTADPTGPAKGVERVLRSTYGYSQTSYVRSSDRYTLMWPNSPERLVSVGFRVARTVNVGN